jgi:mono/diheme cytochrome c family protein
MSLLFVIGIQAIVVGAVLFLASPAIERRWPASSTGIAIARNLVLIVGIVMTAADLAGGQTPKSNTPNPVAETVTSVVAGRAIYQANCAACHGVDGQGGGPLAATTAITPPSLTAHLSGHSDGDLFYWISNGLPGGMPAWSSTISETDRWNVINYLRSINGKVPSAAVPVASRAATLAPVASAVVMIGWFVVGIRRRRVSRSGARPR